VRQVWCIPEACGLLVGQGHEVAVGGAGGAEFAGSFLELLMQAEKVLFESSNFPPGSRTGFRPVIPWRGWPYRGRRMSEMSVLSSLVMTKLMREVGERCGSVTFRASNPVR
jgi:hypothetical protein